jgi:hypothetical protein
MRTANIAAVIQAIIEAHDVVTRQSLGSDDPLARDTRAILDALLVALPAEDEKSLLAGAKWARSVTGKPNKKADLVHQLVTTLDRNAPRWGVIAADCAMYILASGLVHCRLDLHELAAKIEARLTRRAVRANHDTWIEAKEILRASGLTEAAAKNFVGTARNSLR